MKTKGINQQLQELFDIAMPKEQEGIVHQFGDFQFIFHRVNRLAPREIYVPHLCPDNRTRNLHDRTELVEESGYYFTIYRRRHETYVPSVHDGFVRNMADLMSSISNPTKNEFRNLLLAQFKRGPLFEKLMLELPQEDEEDAEEELALAKI